MIRRIVHALRQRGIYVLRKGLPWGTILSRDIRLLGAFPERPVCFDVGANVGQTIRWMKAAWPKSTIHAFEPTPETFDELRSATAHFSNVTCHQVALSSGAGNAKLVRGDISVLNQIQRVDATMRSDSEIELNTIDAFCQHHSIATIHLLKIDTEGHDLEVLRGAQALLAANKIDMILTEVGFGDADRFCLDIDTRELLAKFGYRLMGVYEQSPSIYHSGWPHSGLYFANMLFVRPDYVVRR